MTKRNRRTPEEIIAATEAKLDAMRHKQAVKDAKDHPIASLITEQIATFEKQEREAQERFDQRMSLMDEEYELTDEDREVIASDVKDMEDEDFSAYQEKMKVLLSSKNKTLLEEQSKAEEEAKAKEAEEAEKVVVETKASETTSEVVDKAVDNAEEVDEAVANSTSAGNDTLYDKYRGAFGLDSFDIKI